MDKHNINKDLARTTLYLNKDLYKNLKVIVIKKDLKINDCISNLIKEYVDKNKKYL